MKNIYSWILVVVIGLIIVFVASCSESDENPCYECTYTTDVYDTLQLSPDTIVEPRLQVIVTCYDEFVEELGNDNMSVSEFKDLMRGTSACEATN